LTRGGKKKEKRIVGGGIILTNLGEKKERNPEGDHRKVGPERGKGARKKKDPSLKG